MTEQTAELTPASRKKREHWAQILLDNASDKTSYKLAERLIRDWFGNDYDERLLAAQREVSGESTRATKRGNS